MFLFTNPPGSQTIELPEKLNSKNFDYFKFRNNDMCLIDLDCKQETIDSIFQISDEDKLGNNKYYHAKGPFINSKSIIANRKQEIVFENLNKPKLNILKLKELNDPVKQLDMILKHHEVRKIEQRIKITLINYLERNICNGVFENFELLPIGSSFTGLGMNNGDLDLRLMPKPLTKTDNPAELNEFINQNNLTYLYKQERLNKELTNKCLNMIRNNLSLLPGIRIDQFLAQARVPIIKLSSQILNVEMDISMALSAKSNGVILMCQTLYSYCKLFPNLRKLFVLLRIWATECQLIKPQPSSALKNFTFLMLLIYFLQNTKPLPILPSMHEILTTDQDCLNEYIEANNSVNLFELIPEFLDFLIKTDFNRYSIDLYENKRSRNLNHDPIFIKNPFEMEYPNMAKNMTSRSVIDLKQTCKGVLSNYKPHDLSSLFNLKIQIPDF